MNDDQQPDLSGDLSDTVGKQRPKSAGSSSATGPSFPQATPEPAQPTSQPSPFMRPIQQTPMSTMAPGTGGGFQTPLPGGPGAFYAASQGGQGSLAVQQLLDRLGQGVF